MAMNSISSANAKTAGFVPEDWLLAALEVARAKIVLAKYVTVSSEDTGFSQGDTLNIPYPGTFTAQKKTANNPVVVQQPQNAAKVSVTLTEHASVDFLIEDFASAVGDQDLMKAWMKPAAIALAEQVETDLFTLYSSLTSPSVGVLGTGIGPAAIRSARKVFNDAKIPEEDRFIVLSDADEISVLGDSTLQTYFAFHQTEAVSEATIGRLYGFDIYQSQLVPMFAQASNAAQTVSITGNPTGGTFTLTYLGQTTAAIPYNATAAQVEAALAALSNIGAGKVRCSGGPLPGTAITVLLFVTPAALTHTDSLTGGTSPAVAIANVGTSTNANFNLVLHKEALILAIRRFKDVPEGMGAMISQLTDPVSGLSFRMTAQYDANYKGVHGSLDMLYGFKAMRPSYGLVALS